MSEAWGVLQADAYHRATDGPDGPKEPDRERPAAGAWPEELDVQAFAESSMSIPGQGDPGPHCGTWRPYEFCDECGEPRLAPDRCERRACPDCMNEWTAQRAEGAVRRLAGARHAEPKGIERRAIHAFVSAPEGAVRTLTDVSQGYRTAYELARERGIRGGVCVFHGFRIKEEALVRFRAEDFDGGAWKWINAQPEDWRSLTYWSPHWHIIGLCEELEAETGQDSDGWMCRRIRGLDAMTSLTDRDAYDSMAGAVRYVMSHATFQAQESTDCVRWFGALATANFSMSELSDGAVNTIERMVDEIVGTIDDRGDGPDHGEDCECENCGSASMSPIWDAGYALQDKGWCERIGRDQQRRLNAAFKWAIGEEKPPPGMQRPDTEERAEEAFQALL